MGILVIDKQKVKAICDQEIERIRWPVPLSALLLHLFQ